MSLDPTDALAMAIVEGRTNPGEAVAASVPAGHSGFPDADSDRSPTGDRREAERLSTAPAGRAAEESPATLRIVPPARDRDMPPIPAFLDRTGAA